MTSPPIDSDFSFIRTPFQQFCSLFKRNKRTLEKEVSFFASHLKTMTQNRGNLDRKQTQATIEALRNRLKSSVEAIEKEYMKEDEELDVCEVRCMHLEDLEEYPRGRIRRMVVEYLGREGMVDMAERVERQMRMEKLTDVHIFTEIHSIRVQILSHHLDPALRWCDLHKSRLKRLQSPLEFQLKLQKFLELYKERNYMGAIRYARTHFPTYPQYLLTIQQAMALLAVSSQPALLEQYEALLGDDRWVELGKLYYGEVLRVYSLPTDSTLSIFLHAGLTALKTPLCGCEKLRNPRCPACSEAFEELATRVPLTSHTNSQLMCRILGKPMDEHNPPMALPNGQTYSLLGLQSLSQDRKVLDPETKTEFSLKDLRKVFTL